MKSMADEQRAYIQKIMDKLGITQTELAKKAMLDPSTLSRFMHGGRDGHALRASTIHKIGMATGIRMNGGPIPAAESISGFMEQEAAPWANDESAPLQQAVAAFTAGRNSASAWVLKSSALSGAGYLPGDILIVDQAEQPRSGDIACAQVYDWEAGGADTVFRLYQMPVLVAVCTEAATMKAYVVDDNSVVLRGTVIASIRPRA
jgi:transcriptional regulator with XRE-family HTH domain